MCRVCQIPLPVPVPLHNRGQLASVSHFCRITEIPETKIHLCLHEEEAQVSIGLAAVFIWLTTVTNIETFCLRSLTIVFY